MLTGTCWSSTEAASSCEAFTSHQVSHSQFECWTITRFFCWIRKVMFIVQFEPLPFVNSWVIQESEQVPLWHQQVQQLQCPTAPTLSTAQDPISGPWIQQPLPQHCHIKASLQLPTSLPDPAMGLTELGPPPVHLRPILIPRRCLVPWAVDAPGIPWLPCSWLR